MERAKRLLLISNSRAYNRGYLEHCAHTIPTFLGDTKRVLFIPYALKDMDGYAQTAREYFAELGIELISVHEEHARISYIMDKVDAVFVGGGNTFRLLKCMYEHSILMTEIQARVIEGSILYMGASAGSNLACPTICTTNDMPIVHVPTFDALKLVPFQINPHFIDADPHSQHMGETRGTRIKEFHEENDIPVIGLREGSWLCVQGKKVTLAGSGGAKLFIKGKEPIDIDTTCFLDFLLYWQ
jgi:dipeptidase E